MRLIGDILDFSKMETGALRLAEATFDLDEILDSVRAALAAECRAKNLDFQINVEPETPCDSRATARGWLRSCSAWQAMPLNSPSTAA